MATFYVDRRELELRTDQRALAIYENGERMATLPLNLLERVVVTAPVRFSSSLLGWLARHGVGLLVLGRQDARSVACLLGRPPGDAARRISQYRAFCDVNWRLRWSQRLVRSKCAGQMRTLRRLMRERPDARKPLRDALEQVLRLTREAATAETLPGLMGLEGASAAAYFRALTAVFAPALGFTGRNRRPPRDPVNACLSLAYTLLHYEAVREIHMAGLDPFIGFYHELAWNRESLACDLVEALRPRVDEWTWGLFRERRLRAEHFRLAGPACLLGKAGRRIFYEAYEAIAARMRRQLRRTTRLIVRALENQFPVAKEVAANEEPLY